MEDETVADSDSTSDSKVSTTKYQEIVRTVHNQDIKLKAMKNLHQIIQVKDQELKASCEKAQNLQAALDKAEMRLANQLRLTVTGAHQSTLEADSAEQNATSVSEHFVDKRVSQSMSPIRPAADASEPSTSSSDLEEDCAVEAVSQSTRAFAGHHLKLSSPPSLKETILRSKTVAPETSSVSTRSRDSVALQSRGVGMPPSSLDSVVKTDSIAALDSLEKVSLSGSQSLKSIRSTGVSRDLLDKLMQQNARLKKVIRDILQQKGTSLEDYLDRQEAQDVIAQLRDGLRLSKAQNDKLKDIINSRDSDDISKKYSELSENFLKLKRTAAMMKAMADSYSKEYEKLKTENKDLKEELSAANQKRRSLELKQQKELSSGASTSSISAGAESTISVSLYDSLKLQYDMASMRLSDAEAENGALRSQCLQHQQEADEMRKRCESLSTEKELLKTQVSVFQDDFAVEERKHADKRQQLESSIAKHQDWIRKLVAEAQKCRSLFEEEKGKRERAETAKDEVEKRFRSFITQNRSVSSCGFEENWQRNLPRMIHEDLQVDNGGELASPAPSNASRENLQSSEASEHMPSDPLVCPRCEREFEARDEQKWRDHCARCTDD